MIDSPRPSPGSQRRPESLSPWLRARWQALSLPLLIFLLLPLVALLLRTPLPALVNRLADPLVLQAVLVSLGTTVVATLLIVLAGTPVALLLARRRTPFRQVIDTLIDLPTVLPPAVAGLALLMTFGRRGLLGAPFNQIGIDIAFTPTAVVLAQVFIAAPFYIKAATLGFAAIDPALEQSAALDGASGWQIFRYVILPLSWASLLSGSMMSWARALGEFGATIIFAGNFPGRTQTMPLAIYIGFQFDLDTALTLSVILILCSFIVLMMVKGVLRNEESEYNSITP